jgi:hypothetical protein
MLKNGILLSLVKMRKFLSCHAVDLSLLLNFWRALGSTHDTTINQVRAAFIVLKNDVNLVICNS